MLNRWMIVGVIGAAAIVGCASGTGGARPGNCDAVPGDSAFAASGPAYHACAVDRTAKLNNRPNVDFRPETIANACFSADVEFVVAENGKPETGTARLVRANSASFGDAVMRSLGQWRYDPAMRNGTPVRQIVTEHRVLGEAVIVVPRGSVPHPPDRPPQC